MSEPTSSNAQEDSRAVALAYADASTPHAGVVGGANPLTRFDMATLSLKLLGICLLVQGIGYAGSAFGYLIGGRYYGPGIVIELALLAYYAGSGLALLIQGHRFAGWLLQIFHRRHPQRPRLLRSEIFQGAAFALVGVILIAMRALPALLYAGWIYAHRDIYYSNARPMPQLEPLVFEHLAELVLGLGLFFGSKRLSAYWHRLRAEPRTDADEGPL